MALTQDQVNWWFEQNPDATADEVAAAVQSIGGLEANAGLADMIANRYKIGTDQVTDYYTQYTAPKAPADTSTQTFTDTILNTPVTETELLNTLGTGNTGTATNAYFQANPDVAASFAANSYGMSADDFANFHWNNYGKTEGRVSPTGTPANTSTLTTTTNNTVDTTGATGSTTGATGSTTQEELLAALSSPADNITSSGLTGQAGQMVVEGDDIETQIAQLPTEYAHWSRSADQRYMELIRKSDGAILDRRVVGDFSDLDLAKIGLSFIPGAGQILAGLNVADAARRGDILQAAIGATGLIPGAQNVNTALRVGQAVDSGNPFGAVTALAGNSDVQGLLGLGNVNVGGFTTKDAMAGANLIQAAGNNNYAGVLTNLGVLTNSSDLALAGRAASLYTRLQNGDTRALTDAVNLSNSISGNKATGTSTTLPTGTQIAGLDTGTVSDAGNGYTILGADGNTLTFPDLTGSDTINADAALFNSGVGTLGTDGTGGNITDTTGLDTGDVIPDGGDNLPEVVVTGTGNGTDTTTIDTISGGDGNDTVTDKGTTTIIGKRETCPIGTTLNLETGECDPIVETPCADGYHDDGTGLCVPDDDTTDTTECPAGMVRDLTTGECVTPAIECPPGKVLNEAGTACIDETTIVSKRNPCPPGTKYDEDLDECVPITTECAAGYHDDGTGLCVPDDEPCSDGYHKDESGACVPDDCPEGYIRDLATGQCVLPEQPCPEGYHRDEATGQCVLDTTTLNCPEGYEPNEAGTECIPIIEITSCPTGQHRDENGKCVPDTEECAEGFHLENGLCVPDDDEECKDGYEKVNGVCVPVCAEGYIRNLATGVCEKVETQECPVGQVRNAEGKCVPITKTTECQPGYERVNGVCVPVCQPGYQRVNGVCKKIATPTIPTPATSALNAEGEKTDPIYAGAMDDFDLFATLEELLKENSDKTDSKKDSKKSKEKTKMATGGHLDDLLAEQMTVDDLLKLLR